MLDSCPVSYRDLRYRVGEVGGARESDVAFDDGEFAVGIGDYEGPGVGYRGVSPVGGDVKQVYR